MKELSELFTLQSASHLQSGRVKRKLTKKNYKTSDLSYKVQFLNASTKEIRYNFLFAVNFEYSVTLSYGKVLASL